MKLLVCGGRDFANREFAFAELDRVHKKCPVTLLIHGDALGADTLARDWALDRGVHYAAVPALWKAQGRSAGPRRNEAMLLLQPEGVLAFPGGRGTAHMVEIARAAGIPVREPKP